MKDKLTVAISSDGFIRVYALNGTSLVKEAQRIHSTSPVATVLLGRLLIGASLMSCTLKNERDSLTLQIRGDGPAKTVVAVSDAFGNPRGYIGHPDLFPPTTPDGRMTIGPMIGTEGFFQVVKDLGMREPYTGQVALVSGEVGDEITHYFAASEQIPTACALGVTVDKDGCPDAAGGYIVQLMPGAPEDCALILEERIKELMPPSEMVSKGIDSVEMAARVLGESGCEILSETFTAYTCTCNEDRVRRAIISLSDAEIDELISSGKGTEVTCHFCDRTYTYPPSELENMKKQRLNGSEG